MKPDPLIESLTRWAQQAPPEVRALFANHTSEIHGEKVPKADVNYRPADDPAESCQTCTNFDGGGGCAVVAGRISPDHVSDRYSAGGPSDQPHDTNPDTGARDNPPQ